jgi:transmembrane sensor
MLPGAGLSVEGPLLEKEKRSRRGVFAMVAGVLALLGTGGGYTLLTRPPIRETLVGEQQVVMLDDGTRVSLNTNSKVAILYSEDERRVRLDRGEAMFEVTKDPTRPFVVTSGDEQVRALGTTFIVRRESGKTAVTLLEGKVEVRGDAQAIAVLAPGQRVTVTPTSGAALDRPSVEAVSAWRRGEVVFEDATLLEVAEELNRYSNGNLVVADPSLASLRISGVFSTSDLGEAARAIAELHNLRIRRDAGNLQFIRG